MGVVLALLQGVHALGLPLGPRLQEDGLRPQDAWNRAQRRFRQPSETAAPSRACEGRLSPGVSTDLLWESHEPQRPHMATQPAGAWTHRSPNDTQGRIFRVGSANNLQGFVSLTQDFHL